MAKGKHELARANYIEDLTYEILTFCLSASVEKAEGNEIDEAIVEEALKGHVAKDVYEIALDISKEMLTGAGIIGATPAAQSTAQAPADDTAPPVRVAINQTSTLPEATPAPAQEQAIGQTQTTQKVMNN
jgi:hypothetical protein